VLLHRNSECLDQLPHKVETSQGGKVSDVMRVFQGDGAEQQFEIGEQRGGIGCNAGSGDSRWYGDLTYSFHHPLLSLADHQDIVLEGEKGMVELDHLRT